MKRTIWLAVAAMFLTACAPDAPAPQPAAPAVVPPAAAAPAPVADPAPVPAPVKVVAKKRVRFDAAAEAAAYDKARRNASRAECLRFAADIIGAWAVKFNSLDIPGNPVVTKIGDEECRVLLEYKAALK